VWQHGTHLSSTDCRKLKIEGWRSRPLGRKQNPISKITRAKRVGGVAQMVECLPSKCKALWSNPSTTHTKKPQKAKTRIVESIKNESLYKGSSLGKGEI
jgi:hypothetical protein